MKEKLKTLKKIERYNYIKIILIMYILILLLLSLLIMENINNYEDKTENSSKDYRCIIKEYEGKDYCIIGDSILPINYLKENEE